MTTSPWRAGATDSLIFYFCGTLASMPSWLTLPQWCPATLHPCVCCNKHTHLLRELVLDCRCALGELHWPRPLHVPACLPCDDRSTPRAGQLFVHSCGSRFALMLASRERPLPPPPPFLSRMLAFTSSRAGIAVPDNQGILGGPKLLCATTVPHHDLTRPVLLHHQRCVPHGWSQVHQLSARKLHLPKPHSTQASLCPAGTFTIRLDVG